MPKPMVTQTRLDPSAVVTMSFALDVQVGRDPGAPGAIRFGMMCQSTAIGLVEYRPVVHRFVGVPRASGNSRVRLHFCRRKKGNRILREGHKSICAQSPGHIISQNYLL